MTNADKFKATFGGLYATELWAMPEKDFLDWLNKEYVEEESRDIISMCNSCRFINNKIRCACCKRCMERAVIKKSTPTVLFYPQKDMYEQREEGDSK